MATTTQTKRPFFGASRKPDGCAFIEQSAEFTWHMGMSWQVRQRSSLSLAQSILEMYSSKGLKKSDILEISTASTDYETGQALSAINLIYVSPKTGVARPVENWFQAAKVYGDGAGEYGPYQELLNVTMPKRYLDKRLDKKTVAQYEGDELFWRIRADLDKSELVRFELEGERFGLVPRSLFYDYLYVNALAQEQNAELAGRLLEYRVFTDIMFNPGEGKNRRYNTQARSCAIFVSLAKRDLLNDALESVSAFESLVDYPEEAPETLF